MHSTLWGDLPPDVVVHDRRELGSLGTLRSLLAATRPGDVVMVNGAIGLSERWRDLLIAAVLRRVRPRVGLVVADATWTARSLPGETHSRRLFAVISWWNKALLTAVQGPRTHVCLLSRAECEEYVRDTGVPAERVHFTPYPANLQPDEVTVDVTDPGDGYVFAPGDTLRDWDLLRAAVGTDLPVKVAARRDSGRWPANVTVAALDHEDFLHQMARSSVVVLPLDTRTTRSAGQQTYLTAMVLGRPVVITDAAGVRDYITPSVDGYVVPNHADDLRAALRAALAGGQDVRAVAARAVETAREHTLPGYWRRLTEIARAATR